MNSIILGAIVVVLVVIGGLFALGYKKASPDEALIVSGIKKDPRIIVGKATFCIPFLERVDRLSLSILKIDVKTKESVPTNEFINVNVDAVATIRLMSDHDGMQVAIKNFLNKENSYINEMVNDVLEGNIREIVGEMTLPSMVKDRKAFAEKVQQNAVPDMNKMGIDIVSFNVQSFSDNDNVIVNLGMENVSKIKKDASIVKAEADKEVKIKQAETQQQSREAELKSATEIAQKETDLAIRKSELQIESDKKKAEADSSYTIEKETQRKQVEFTRAEADLEKTTKQIEISAQEALVTAEELKATIEAQAKAERVAQQEQAEADKFVQQQKAEAELYKVKQQAEAIKAKAEADKTVELAKAEGLKAVYEAEAGGIRAKGLAEAEGTNAKAEAMRKMGEASVLEMYFNALPQVAESLATPLSNIDSITMFGEGNTAKLTKDVTTSMEQIMNGVSSSLGFDVKSVLEGFLTQENSNIIEEKLQPKD